jgi:hypothetical protein
MYMGTTIHQLLSMSSTISYIHGYIVHEKILSICGQYKGLSAKGATLSVGTSVYNPPERVPFPLAQEAGLPGMGSDR